MLNNLLQTHMRKLTILFLAMTVFAVALPASAHNGMFRQYLSGFGDANNTSAIFLKHTGCEELYAATGNTNGTELWKWGNYSFPYWVQITDTSAFGFLADANNTEATAKAAMEVNSGTEREGFVAFKNMVTGAEIWRASCQDDILTATQVNTDGFGNAANTEVLHLVRLNHHLFAYVRNSDTGRVSVFKSSMKGTNWTEVKTLSANFNGLDAAERFQDAIYLANGNPARIYRSTDGVTYTQIATLDGQVADLERIPLRNALYAAEGGAADSCGDARPKLWSTPDGDNWSVIKNRPDESFCYDQIVSRRSKDKVRFMGLDAEDGVMHRRSGSTWYTVTTSGMGNRMVPEQDPSNNRRFSDGAFFMNDFFAATENTTEGVQIWGNALIP
jgi:hypothetical protein